MEINYDVPPRRAAEADDPDAKTRGPKAHELRTARGKKNQASGLARAVEPSRLLIVRIRESKNPHFSHMLHPYLMHVYGSGSSLQIYRDSDSMQHYRATGQNIAQEIERN